jgi:hypothetical protein
VASELRVEWRRLIDGGEAPGIGDAGVDIVRREEELRC